MQIRRGWGRGANWYYVELFSFLFIICFFGGVFLLVLFSFGFFTIISSSIPTSLPLCVGFQKYLTGTSVLSCAPELPYRAARDTHGMLKVATDGITLSIERLRKGRRF